MNCRLTIGAPRAAWIRDFTNSIIRSGITKLTAGLFLNCTKNTELTAAVIRPYSRFRPQQKNWFSPGQKIVRSEFSRYAVNSGHHFFKKVLRLVQAGMNPWITYRTRFLVKAKQLSNNLSFTDHLGRQHSGVRGDYLVEWSDGVLRIAPRKIFEDVYVPIMERDIGEDIFVQPKQPGRWQALPHRVSSAVVLDRISTRAKANDEPLKKSPQPCRERASGSSQNCM